MSFWKLIGIFQPITPMSVWWIDCVVPHHWIHWQCFYCQPVWRSLLGKDMAPFLSKGLRPGNSKFEPNFCLWVFENSLTFSTHHPCDFFQQKMWIICNPLPTSFCQWIQFKFIDKKLVIPQKNCLVMKWSHCFQQKILFPAEKNVNELNLVSLTKSSVDLMFPKKKINIHQIQTNRRYTSEMFMNPIWFHWQILGLHPPINCQWVLEKCH